MNEALAQPLPAATAHHEADSFEALYRTADALDDAVASLQGSLNFLLRALGALLPVGLVLSALWFGGRTLTRRRRESALA